MPIRGRMRGAMGFPSPPRGSTHPTAAPSHPIPHLKPVREGVAVVDDDGVEPGDARPAFDRGDDGVAVAELGAALDPAGEGRADDALVHELVPFLEAAGGGELR